LVEGEKKGKKLILIFFVLNATFSYIMATSEVLSKTSSTCPGYHPSEYAIATVSPLENL
jgi:hypothetical protein